MIELLCKRKQLGVWNKLSWNNPHRIGIRWEALIRQAYWHWSMCRGRTKRCDLAGLLSSAAVLAGLARLTGSFSTLLKLRSNKGRFCENAKGSIAVLFRDGDTSCCWHCSWQRLVGEVGRGSGAGCQHVNLGGRCCPRWPRQVWEVVGEGDGGEGLGRSWGGGTEPKSCGTEVSRG